VDGARWVQEDILTKHKDADLEVYAIWFSMYPTDLRERWPAEILTDPRVVHYWDDAKNVGKWYGDRFREMESSVAPNSSGLGAPVLWDAYLVYGPEARWDEAPTGLRRWGRTILRTQDALRQSVDDVLSTSKQVSLIQTRSHR
jgi:hypothetical protein